MAKNKYTVVWWPDYEVNTYVSWIELDFEVHQYIDSSLWKEMLQALLDVEELPSPDVESIWQSTFEIYAVFEGHLDCKWSNI